jgi:hypothetical protein
MEPLPLNGCKIFTISVCINTVFVEGKIGETFRLFENQIKDFLDAGYPPSTTVYAVISAPPSESAMMKQYVREIRGRFLRGGFLGVVQVLLYLGNAYELPALHVAWVASCMNRARNHVLSFKRLLSFTVK